MKMMISSQPRYDHFDTAAQYRLLYTQPPEKSRLIFALDRGISQCYTMPEHRSAIYRGERVVRVNAHIRKVYVPMTETGFYILLCLGEENHGYGIIQRVEQLTGGEIRLSPGTMYGSLSKMERDGLIEFVREEEKRKLYRLTALGRQVLELETRRISRLYRNMKEVCPDEL